VPYINDFVSPKGTLKNPQKTSKICKRETNLDIRLYGERNGVPPARVAEGDLHVGRVNTKVEPEALLYPSPSPLIMSFQFSAKLLLTVSYTRHPDLIFSPYFFLVFLLDSLSFSFFLSVYFPTYNFCPYGNVKFDYLLDPETLKLHRLTEHE
jgi:hypothetical protein